MLMNLINIFSEELVSGETTNTTLLAVAMHDFDVVVIVRPRLVTSPPIAKSKSKSESKPKS